MRDSAEIDRGARRVSGPALFGGAVLGGIAALAAFALLLVVSPA